MNYPGDCPCKKSKSKKPAAGATPAKQAKLSDFGISRTLDDGGAALARRRHGPPSRAARHSPDGGASLTQWPLDRLRLLLAVRPPDLQFAHAHPLDCPVCICRASYDEYNTGWMADLA